MVVERDPLLLRQRAEGVALLRHDLCDIAPLRGDLVFSRLNLVDIENITDQPQQGLRRRPRQLDRLFTLTDAQLRFRQQFQKADDGAHRRAQLVAHAGQKATLGFCRLNRFVFFPLQGAGEGLLLRQLLLQPLLRVFTFAHFPAQGESPAEADGDQHQREGDQLVKLAAVLAPVLYLLAGNFRPLLGHLQNIPRRNGLQRFAEDGGQHRLIARDRQPNGGDRESVDAGVVQTLWIIVVDHIAGGKLRRYRGIHLAFLHHLHRDANVIRLHPVNLRKARFQVVGGDWPHWQGDPRRAGQQMWVGGAAAGDQHKSHVNQRVAEGDVGLRLWCQGRGGHDRPVLFFHPLCQILTVAHQDGVKLQPGL